MSIATDKQHRLEAIINLQVNHHLLVNFIFEKLKKDHGNEGL